MACCRERAEVRHGRDQRTDKVGRERRGTPHGFRMLAACLVADAARLAHDAGRKKTAAGVAPATVP